MCEWKTTEGVCIINSEEGYTDYCHEGPCSHTCEDNKSLFLTIVEKDIDRPGIKNLMDWLEDSDFYTAPASTKYHGAKEGGLLEHSLQVYRNLRRLTDFYVERGDVGYISAESIAVVALFHDLCKVNTYKETWEGNGWFHDEEFKFGGHGSKSVYILGLYIMITPSEAAAINCHMGAFENKYVGEVYERNPLAWLLHMADEEAAYIQKV